MTKLSFSRRGSGPKIVLTPDCSITPAEMMSNAKVFAWTTAEMMSTTAAVVDGVSAVSAVEEREGQTEHAGRRRQLRDAEGFDLDHACRLWSAVDQEPCRVAVERWCPVLLAVCGSDRSGDVAECADASHVACRRVAEEEPRVG